MQYIVINVIAKLMFDYFLKFNQYKMYCIHLFKFCSKLIQYNNATISFLFKTKID